MATWHIDGQPSFSRSIAAKGTASHSTACRSCCCCIRLARSPPIRSASGLRRPRLPEAGCAPRTERPCSARASPSRLRGRRYRWGVVIHDQPTPVAIPVNKTGSRRANDFRAIADLRESMGSGVDGDIAMDANALLTEGHLARRRDGAQNVEAFTNGGGVVAKRHRAGAPQHCFS